MEQWDAADKPQTRKRKSEKGKRKQDALKSF